MIMFDMNEEFMRSLMTSRPFFDAYGCQLDKCFVVLFCFFLILQNKPCTSVIHGSLFDCYGEGIKTHCSLMAVCSIGRVRFTLLALYKGYF